MENRGVIPRLEKPVSYLQENVIKIKYRPIHFAKVHTTYSSVGAFADGLLYRI